MTIDKCPAKFPTCAYQVTPAECVDALRQAVDRSGLRQAVGADPQRVDEAFGSENCRGHVLRLIGQLGEDLDEIFPGGIE